MNLVELREIERYLTDEERDELHAILEEDIQQTVWRALPGPQTQAEQSLADIIGFGGAAGGGKTDLICGLVLTEHERALVVRREKAQTEGVVQRLVELIDGTTGYNSQKGQWKLPNERGTLLELAGLDNPGDERRWQGRPHDLKAFDEVTEMREQQVRFMMGWNRSRDPSLRCRVLMTFNPPTTNDGRWVLEFFGPWLDKKNPLYPTLPGVLRYCAMLPDGRGGSSDTWLDAEGKPLSGKRFVIKDGKVCYEFNPADYRPEDIITPKSRTFIPSRLTDNPYYMASGYMSTLQALPEPLRSQMLYGDFEAGMSDDVWQVIPTKWVELAMARWKERTPKGEMLTLGVDVARGGKDNTVLAAKHRTENGSLWFDKPKVHPGTETPDGPKVAGLVVGDIRDGAVILIDVIGVGSSPYDVLNGMNFQIHGINVAEKARGFDKSGRLSFFNYRSELVWRMRELLDPANDTGAALPPDPQLLRELCSFRWSLQGMTVYVESREDIIKRIGKSPDLASAYILANIDVPKLHALRSAGIDTTIVNYDPLASMR